MTSIRHFDAHLEFPSALEVLLTRDFEAPIELVFDVLTKPEHMRHWYAAFEDELTVLEVDLRVGGEYHIVSVVAESGLECSFRGTYLEIQSPTRTVETWQFDGWPGVEAVETVDLREVDGVTTMSLRLTFRDQAGRDHMSKTDGFIDSSDKMAQYLRSLVDTSTD
jgi:uncharacterized protein YndB with AHSA1/START domain